MEGEMDIHRCEVLCSNCVIFCFKTSRTDCENYPTVNLQNWKNLRIRYKKLRVQKQRHNRESDA